MAATDAQVRVTRKELLQACKAVADQVRGDLQSRLDAAEGEIGLRVGRAMEARLDKAFGDALAKSVGSLVDARAGEIEKKADERVEFLRRSYESGLEKLETLLRSISVFPVVNVAAAEVNVPAPVVNVLAAEVHVPQTIVNVPELPAFPAPVVNFTAPEPPAQPPPVINVAVPRQEPSIVNVSVPRRKVIKTIEYDQHGRPATVSEEEVDR